MNFLDFFFVHGMLWYQKETVNGNESAIQTVCWASGVAAAPAEGAANAHHDTQ